MAGDATQQLDKDSIALMEGCNQFAVSLYLSVSQAQNDNVIFSPSSLSIALAMTLAGASNETANEIADAMKISSLGDRFDVHSPATPQSQPCRYRTSFVNAHASRVAHAPNL